MIDRIGLTGSTGSLGNVILQNNKKINFKCFKGDISETSTDHFEFGNTVILW